MVENKGFTGHHHSASARKRIRESHTGVRFSQEHCEKIRAAKLGALNPMFGKHWTQEAKTKSSEKLKLRISPTYGHKMPASQKSKISAKTKGRLNPMFGRLARHLSYVDAELGHVIRSSWERGVCVFLKTNKIPYKYEPRCFDLGEMSYIPDIELSDSLYVEVKGAMLPGAITKISRFLDKFPEYRLVLICSTSSESNRLEASKLMLHENLVLLEYKGDWRLQLLRICKSKEAQDGRKT